MPASPEPLNYSSGFVQSLFEEMSSTYGMMNTITSFGFSERWRCQAVQALELEPGDRVCDLMCGMGESWKYVWHHHPGSGELVGADFCAAMCEGARKKKHKTKRKVRVQHMDVLETEWPDPPVDAVVCTFGLKTLDHRGLDRLATKLAEILRPGGQFSFVEISVPKSKALRIPYLFYLEYVIPPLGKLFLGNPDNYRFLGRFTRAFQHGGAFAGILKDLGYEVEYRELFFGCASLVSGRVPVTFPDAPSAP